MHTRLLIRLALFGFLFFESLTISAQDTIAGKVYDLDTGQGIAFATVYLNGTTIGTVTDEQGYFQLPNTSYPVDLVVSHVGYESQVIPLASYPANQLQIGIPSNSVNLEEVPVEDKNNRARNIREFKDLFLGTDNIGKKAVLTNEKVLLFSRDYEKKTIQGDVVVQNKQGKDTVLQSFERPLNLKAKTLAPLVIDQPALGYKIKVDLVDFKIIYGEGWDHSSTYQWLGYYFFEPYTEKSKSQQKRYQKIRNQVYFNSPMHFLRSLYQNALPQNGYRLFERVIDSLKQEASIVNFDIAPYLFKNDQGELEIRGLKGKTIFLFYYPDGKGNPIDLTRKKGRQPLQSDLLLKKDLCLVRKNGTLPDLNIVFGGVITLKKAGAMLPDSFEPYDLKD